MCLHLFFADFFPCPAELLQQIELLTIAAANKAL